jgi:hypothetical protein
MTRLRSGSGPLMSSTGALSVVVMIAPGAKPARVTGSPPSKPLTSDVSTAHAVPHSRKRRSSSLSS